MNQLKIEIPEGFEVESFDQTTGTVKFKQKSLPLIGRVNTFEAVCHAKGVNPKDYELTSDIPRIRARQGLDRVLLICELFQQEAEELDPNNTDQKKWSPWFDLRVSDTNPSGFRFFVSNFTFSCTYSVISPLLWLPSEEVSNYVGKTFEAEFRNVIKP